MEKETEILIEKLLNDSYDLAIDHAIAILDKLCDECYPETPSKYLINSELSKLKKDTQ